MKKRDEKKGMVLFTILILLAAFAEPTISVLPPSSNAVYFVPLHSNITECPGNITVELRVNTTDAINNWNTYIDFDPDCVNITGYSFAGSPISHIGGWKHHGNWIDIGATKNVPDDSCISGDILLATLTIECKACDCSSPLTFTGPENVFRYIGCTKAFEFYPAAWYNGTVTCGAPQTPAPDLTPTEITTPANIFANVSNAIKATVENIGDGGASSFYVSLTANGAQVEEVSVDSLNAGASREVSFEWTPTSTGGYELCVFADAGVEVEESDETNNELCKSIIVEEQPDLTSNTVYFVPQHGTITECPDNNLTVELRVNTTDAINNWNTYIEFDPGCANITGCSFAGSPISHISGWTHHGKWIDIGATKNVPDDSCISGDMLLATLTIECKACGCSSPLNFTGPENVFRYIGCAKAFEFYPAAWYNGSVTCGAPPTVPEVVINEFMANPSAGNDWVELYNPTENAVDLSGWTLDDNTSQMDALSGTIPADGYLVVDVESRLNKNDDSIILLKDGVDVDNVSYGTKSEDAPVSPTAKSTGRYPNGVDTDSNSADFRVFDIPTPGAPNTLPPATPFLIFGWVNYSDGSPVDNPNVTITNLNTTEVFTAETSTGSNYYRVSTSSDNVSTGNVLHFEASNDNTTEFDHTVTEEEMNINGGIFDLNITIETAPTLIPDLSPVACNLTTPAHIYANMSNTINAIIENTGGADATAFNVSLSADGTLIGKVRLDSLNAAASEEVSFEWTPASGGDYELCVVADTDAEVDESDEANNELCKNVTVEEQPKPDLTPTAITASDHIYANMSNTIKATIENIGGADAAAFNVSLSADGTLIGEVRLDSLSAAASAEVSFEWTPASGGDYELCVVADTGAEVEESDEDNNELCEDVIVEEGPWGLRVDIGDYVIPPDSSVKVPITIYDIQDYGTGTICVKYDPVVAQVTSVSSSPDSTVIGSNIDNPLGTTCISAWNTTGVSGNIIFAYVTFKAAGPEGSSTTLNLSVSDLKDIDYNDIPTYTVNGSLIIERPRPDLTPTAITTPANSFANMSNTVKATIENIGDEDASSFNVSLTANGSLAGEVRVDSLSAGASEEVSFEWIPTSAGSYELCVIADSDTEVKESDETNNELCENVTARERPIPEKVRVDIGNYTIPSDSSVKVPITIYDIQDYGTGTICVKYNPLVAQVTSVSSSPNSTVISSNINNPYGIACVSAWNTTGVSGNIVFAYVTFKAVGPAGSFTSLNLTVSDIEDIYYNDIPAYTVNGSLMVIDDAPPIVGNPIATPSIILNDNGRARVPGTNVSQLNVSVADASGVRSVTINLTAILGPGNDCVPMCLIKGNNKSGIWSVTTNANYDPGVDKMHYLHVNATDIFENSNTDKCILLTVLRRGDVVRNNKVDIGDAYYIARYTVGLEPKPNEFVAGVVPADSYDGVDMSDALYIARYTVGLEPAP